METIIRDALAAAESLPPAARAAGALLLGWLLALALRALTHGLLALLRFDTFAEKTGLAGFLRKGKVAYPPSRLAGVLAFWLAVSAAFLAAARELDLEAFQAVSVAFNAAVPGFLAALLVTVVGLIALGFAANLTGTIARNAAFAHAGLAVRAVRWVGGLALFLLVLDQLGLGASVLGNLVLLAFAAFAFGAALAFGLGCKDMAGAAMKAFLAELRERERERGGTDLEG